MYKSYLACAAQMSDCSKEVTKPRAAVEEGNGNLLRDAETDKRCQAGRFGRYEFAAHGAGRAAANQEDDDMLCAISCRRR